MTGGRRKRQSDQSDSSETTSSSENNLLQLLAQQQQQLTQQQATLSQLVQHLSVGSSAPGSPTLATTTTPSSTSTPTPVVRGLSTPKLSSPDDTSIPQFRDWKQRWGDYSKAQQLNLQPLDTQQGILRAALDSEWTILWNSGRLHIAETDTLVEIVAAMEAYLRSRRNPLLDRQLYHRRDQMTGESVDRYYAALKTLDDAAAHDTEVICSSCSGVCDFGCSTCNTTYPLNHTLQEIRIRDRLICGLIDKEMQKRVLVEPFNKLTLEKVLSICTAVENSNTTGATLSSTPRQTEACSASSQSAYKRQQASGSQKKLPRLANDGTCIYCGKAPHNKREDCSAWNKKCDSCGKTGHFKKMCLQTDKSSTRDASATPSQQMTSTSGNNMLSAAIQQLLTIETTVAGTRHLIKWLPDTGAEVDAISLADFQALDKAQQTELSNDIEDVVAANGESLGPIGSCRATLRLNGRQHNTMLRVFKQVMTPLLSKEGCIALGLIDKHWPYSQITQASSISKGTCSNAEHSIPPDVTFHKAALLEEFADVFDDKVLRPMKGDPMSISLIDEAVPTKRFRAHTVPFHWREEVKQQLDSMQVKGIIEPVPVGEPIDWCHPMVVVPKKGSSEPRITVDLTGLNKYVRRPTYPVRVPKEACASIPFGNKFFSTFDARHGYWQVPLDEDSRKLTTFITPWGCYRFLRNVMGLTSAGDEHNRRGDEALQGLGKCQKIVEDIIVYDSDLQSHIDHIRHLLERCREHRITLNRKKFVFAQPEVEWCGFTISSNGYTPAPHLISALTNFPVPTCKTDVRSFCGLVQQFEAFSHRITELMAPIRSLLSAKSAFIWDSLHQQAFEATIKELTSSRVLANFQPGQPLRLETDAAQSRGLGYALWQQQVDLKWKLLQVGSRFVTSAESRYSASEIEMLAVAWGVKKCRLFLLGHPFELVVDHRPLIPIINKKTLDEIDNPRLLRLKEKLSSYQVTAIWRAGTKHKVVDVFSRFPVADPDEEDTCEALDDDPAPLLLASLHDVEGIRILSDPQLEAIKEVARTCTQYRRLKEYIANGFPAKPALDDDLHSFWKVREGLICYDDLIYFGTRIVIPAAYRSSVLKTLHKSHQGETKTLRRARQAVFWPNITNDICNVVRTCRECAKHRPSLAKEPLQSDPPSTYPFETVSTDLFSYAGYEYLTLVDRFTGWLLIAKCGNSASASQVIQQLQTWFTDYGIPVKLCSDNGPQFSSLEFRQWAEKWGIQHQTSSPHYPQSNGLAESGVKSLKNLLRKTSEKGNLQCSEFQEGLLELRNTPLSDGQSPAQLLFGHPIRSRLPLHRSSFLKTWTQRSRDCDMKADNLRAKAHSRYDKQARALAKLTPGDFVLIQDHVTKQWNILAEVMEACQGNRSYLVRTESGRVLRRNRRFLRRFDSREDNQQVTSEQDLEAPRRSARLRGLPPSVNVVRCVQSPHLEGGHVTPPCLVLPLLSLSRQQQAAGSSAQPRRLSLGSL